MLRQVRPQDVAAITEIYKVYVEQSTVTFETAPLSVEEIERRVRTISWEHPFLVWEEAGTVVGYCYAHRWREREAYSGTWETTVYLAPRQRGRGLGRRLMEALVEECRGRGVHALVACITADNGASIELHRRLGFREVSRFVEVGRKFGRWLDVVDYELIL